MILKVPELHFSLTGFHNYSRKNKITRIDEVYEPWFQD